MCGRQGPPTPPTNNTMSGSAISDALAGAVVEVEEPAEPGKRHDDAPRRHPWCATVPEKDRPPGGV